jgi:hypothetical protein
VIISVERERKQGDVVAFFVSYVAFRRRAEQAGYINIPSDSYSGDAWFGTQPEQQLSNSSFRAYPQFLQRIPGEYLKYAQSLPAISSPLHFIF